MTDYYKQVILLNIPLIPRPKERARTAGYISYENDEVSSAVSSRKGTTVSMSPQEYRELINTSSKPKVKMRAFTPTENKAQALEFSTYAKMQMKQQKVEPFPKDMPLMMTYAFHMPIPKSYTPQKRADCLSGLLLPVHKPDTDNLLKFIKDALNKIAWHDDSQVVVNGSFSGKYYAEFSRTLIKIEPFIASNFFRPENIETYKNILPLLPKGLQGS